MLSRRSFVLTVLAAALGRRAFAQDPLAKSRVAALRGLSNIALVFRDNSSLEVFSPKEWANLAEISLGHNAPDLRILMPESSPNWLELSVVTTEQGGAIEVALHRLVTVSATGQKIIAKVWSESRFVFGSVSKQVMKDSLESLLLGFAADYLRAKRR